MANDIGTSIQRSIRRLTILSCVLLLLLIATIVYVYIDSESKSADTSRLATRTTAALCTFVADLAERRDQGVAFRKAHPHGALGFSAAQIDQTINSEGRTIKALSTLDCPPPPPVASP